MMFEHPGNARHYRMKEVKVVGAEVSRERMRRISEAMKDTTAIHRRIGVKLVQWGQRNFRASGLEKRWKPLSQSTLLGRRKSKSPKPLRDTGTLAKQFLEFKATQTDVRWGSPSLRAAWHHFGSEPYTILPQKKKALAFPHAAGKKLPKSTARSLAKARGRSQKQFGTIPFLVVKKVDHPGLPSRPLLPTERTSDNIAQKTIKGYIAEKIRT